MRVGGEVGARHDCGVDLHLGLLRGRRKDLRVGGMVRDPVALGADHLLGGGGGRGGGEVGGVAGLANFISGGYFLRLDGRVVDALLLDRGGQLSHGVIEN